MDYSDNLGLLANLIVFLPTSIGSIIPREEIPPKAPVCGEIVEAMTPGEKYVRQFFLQIKYIINSYKVLQVTSAFKCGYQSINDLVGGIPTPLKNMSLSVGIMKFPTEWKVIKFMFQTTNQYMMIYD
jgi:hypothetical protein